MGDYRGAPSLSTIVRALVNRVATLERESGGLPTYTTATLPAATTVRSGTVAYVSDESAGSKVQYSDGTNWVVIG